MKKVAFDQLLFSPVCILSCLAAAGAAERSSLATVKQEVVQKGNGLA